MSFRLGAGLFLVCKLFVFFPSSSQAQIMSVDLGHEFFKVALMRQGFPMEIVLNAHSKRKTPTAVSFMEKNRAFGDEAIGHASKAPTKVPLFFHHMLRNNFTSADDVKADGAWWKAFGLSSQFYSYDLGYDAERGVPVFQFSAEGDLMSNEEVLANMFHFARRLTEDYAEGKTVRDLVVTVPSDATLRQRQAIVAAGEIADCRVLTLVHETSAFAVQRAVDFQPEKGDVDYIMFYNLGSRKAEVSIAKFESKQAGMVAGKTAPVVTILGSAVDLGVGGHMFDLKIADVMLKRFQEKFPKLADGVVKNAKALRKLLSTAQKTKAVLSANKNAPFIVESLFEDTDFQSKITREEFEEMCKDEFAMLTPPIEKALADANVTAADITGIEVVGGAWRVPKIQAILSEFMNEKSSKKLPLGQHLNGEEGAAQGSLLVGANGSSSFRVKKIFYTDITMHEYAVQVASLSGEWEKNITVLYPTGIALGAKKKLSFGLEEDFEIRLFENGVLLSAYHITGLENATKGKWSSMNLTGTPKITVSVPLDISGIIEVKDPKAVVEETYWVNVTVTKNVTKNETKDNSTEAPAEEKTEEKKEDESTEEKKSEEADENKDEEKKDEEKKDEEKKDEDEEKKDEDKTEENATSENKTEENATVETEVIQKKKSKKHEKKLTVKRIDFAPLPLTTEQIKAAKAKFDAMAKEEEEVAKVLGLKNELEASVYGSRDKLDSELLIKVTTEEQREEVSKLLMEYEEWMYEGSSEKNEYEKRVNQLKDLLGPMEERTTEMEAREDLPDAVKEHVDQCKAAEKSIKKNMTWINENKTADASAKLVEFEEWWAKKQEKQASLPLHEAPAYTKVEVMDAVKKVYKDFASLLKTKKPKEKKEKKDDKKKSKDDKKDDDNKDDDKKDEKDALPEDVEGTEAALKALADEKAAAVEKEDYDAAHKLKGREKALKEHLASLKEKSEL